MNSSLPKVESTKQMFIQMKSPWNRVRGVVFLKMNLPLGKVKSIWQGFMQMKAP